MQITKSEFAKELRISKARVSQLVADGLPVRAGGRLERTEALEWVARNKTSTGWSARDGRPDVGCQAAELLKPEAENASAAMPSARDLIDLLTVRSVEIPRILFALGVQDPVALAAAVDVFRNLIVDLAGSAAYPDGDFPPEIEESTRLVSRLVGVAHTAEIVERVDAIMDQYFHISESTLTH